MTLIDVVQPQGATGFQGAIETTTIDISSAADIRGHIAARPDLIVG